MLKSRYGKNVLDDFKGMVFSGWLENEAYTHKSSRTFFPYLLLSIFCHNDISPKLYKLSSYYRNHLSYSSPYIRVWSDEKKVHYNKEH
jgi:hypothetical protein